MSLVMRSMCMDSRLLLKSQFEIKRHLIQNCIPFMFIPLSVCAERQKKTNKILL